MQLKEKIKDSIFYYTNVIENPQEIIDIVERLDTYPGSYAVMPKWEDWGTSSEDGVYFGKKKDFNPDNFSEVQEELGKDVLYITNSIREAIMQVANAFYSDSSIEKEPDFSKNVRISKYVTGASMGPHYDTMGGDNSLAYSIVFYYNDNYDGGEVSFTITDEDFPISKEPDFIIKPEAGSALVFPSSKPYYHQVHLVRGGEKYISPAFIFNR